MQKKIKLHKRKQPNTGTGTVDRTPRTYARYMYLKSYKTLACPSITQLYSVYICFEWIYKMHALLQYFDIDIKTV